MFYIFEARRISTPLDAPFEDLALFESARYSASESSGVERHYGGKSKRHPPLSPFEGGTCPFSGVERHIGAESKCHPPLSPFEGGSMPDQ